MDESKEKSLFSTSIIIIIIFEFCVKFAYAGLRGILPLYIVDVLKYKETEATIFYHTWASLIYFFTIAGGIISDSWFGNFKSIIYSNAISIIGLLLLTFTAIPPMHLPVREITILSLFIASIGLGAARPCIPAFGGDQFVLPQQSKQLSLFFVWMSVSHNIGSLSSSFIMPVLRKDVTCFGEITCYSLAFIFPAILIFFMIGTFILTKRLYKVVEPKKNVILKSTKCICYALYRKITSKEKHEHWLNYADKKYDLEMIEDIKSASKILTLFVPLIVLWAVLGMQTSTWTFQASRMNGEFAGYVIKPDQVHAFNPLFVIIFAPIFHSYLYPVIGKYCFLNTPLRKTTVGCLLAALAYFISGIVELNLEPTYAVTPVKDFGQLRIYNTLNCDVLMKVDGQNFKLKGLNMWSNISVPISGRKTLKYEADFRNCEIYGLSSNSVLGDLEVIENQATSWAITKEGLSYNFMDTVNKSMSGNPLVRALIYVDENISTSQVVLSFKQDKKVFESISISRNITESDFKEVTHRTYDLYLNDQLVESNVALKLGGVYTVIGFMNSNATAIHTVTVTQPNSVHILWVIPQQALLAFSEIMTIVIMTEFAFAEAPSSMKALLQAFLLFTASFGNLLVISIAEMNLFERKVYELFFYSLLMTGSTAIFVILSVFYKYKNNKMKDIKHTDIITEQYAFTKK